MNPLSWSMGIFQAMCQNRSSMRSKPVFSGMYRAMKTWDSDRQAARHPAERERPTGASGQEVTGLAHPRAEQDLAAAVPAHAQPRSCQGAGPQHLHRAQHLSAEHSKPPTEWNTKSSGSRQEHQRQPIAATVPARVERVERMTIYNPFQVFPPTPPMKTYVWNGWNGWNTYK